MDQVVPGDIIYLTADDIIPGDSLIVPVIRTRLPFFKSLPEKLLSIATILVLVFVLLVPALPLANRLDFTPLPLHYYWWVLLIVTLYLFSAELAKRWFYRNLKERSQK